MSEQSPRKLDYDEIEKILTGVQAQVEWNGWEAPYVMERFISELRKVRPDLAPKQREWSE